MSTRIKGRLWATTILVGIGVTWAAVAITAQGSRIRRGAESRRCRSTCKGSILRWFARGVTSSTRRAGAMTATPCLRMPPAGTRFMGQSEVINAECYLAGGAAFGPGIVSRNITPRANGRPANRTLAQFKELMHTGRDFRQRRHADPPGHALARLRQDVGS